MNRTCCRVTRATRFDHERKLALPNVARCVGFHGIQGFANGARRFRIGPQISELEQGIEAAENWVEGSRNEVRLEAGVADERKFNEMAAPIETKHDAPWLRSGKDETGAEIIRVVDLDRGVERPATPDEVERGVFYTSYEHYKEGKVP